jgi:hypothetical protein
MLLRKAGLVYFVYCIIDVIGNKTDFQFKGLVIKDYVFGAVIAVSGLAYAAYIYNTGKSRVYENGFLLKRSPADFISVIAD